MGNISRRFVVTLAALALVGGIARAQDVKYNFATGTDFGKFKTYRWIDLPAAEKPDALVDQQIRDAIDANLAKKGLTKATGENADVLVAYQVAVTQERQWNAYSTGGYGYGGYGWRYGGMGGGMTTATSSTLNVGTLAFDMYDTSAKKLVWKGTATKTLNPSKDPKKNQERLQKAMDKLLKNFPPKEKA
jgi:hypothetical protein